MNKVEYLEALKEALKDTDKDVMDEILSDYEEHFQVGMENGKTEEEICEELGSIEDLVEEIKEVYGTENKSSDSKQKKQEEKTKENQDGAFHFKFDKFHFDNINGDTIGDVINSALNAAGEALSEIDVKAVSKTVMSTLDQAFTAFGDFTDSCMNGMGFDTGSCSSKAAEGTSENVSRSYGTGNEVKENDTEFEEAEKTSVPSKLVIDGTVADIIVKKSESGMLNLSYINNGNSRQKRIYEFYSCQDGETVYAGVRKVGKSVFLMDFSDKALVITVELPETMESVQLKTANGAIDIKECVTDKISLNSASGNLKLNKVSAGECQVRAVSGRIDIADMNGTRVSANSTSGNISVKNVETNKLFLKSTSGSLELNTVNTKVLECEALSGSIKFRNVKTSDSKVKNTGGGITINDFHMNNADISSVSGELNLSNITGDGLRTNTVSGAIMLDATVNQCYAGSKSGHIDVQSKGDIMLESNNISGNINVHLKNNGNGYRINSKTTSGRLTVDYDQQHSSNLKTGTYTYGNQGSDLTLSTVSGSMHLRDN